MATHLLNLFRIENLRDLAAEYRLVAVDIPCMSGAADEDHGPESLSLLAKRVAYTERVPVAIVRRDGEPFLAVPTKSRLSTLEYDLTPEVATLKPRDETRRASFRAPNCEEHSVALSFLRFNLRSPLFHCRDLWSSGTATYFSKRPLNYRENAREVDIYRGFTYRLVEIDGLLHLALDLTHRYAESAWLLHGRSPDDWPELRMRHVLYHFGDQWSRAQLLDVLNRPIRETRFPLPDGSGSENVFDYTLGKFAENPPPWIQNLDPASPAVAYRYLGNNKKRYGAAALCKLLLPTEHPTVAKLHGRSMPPPNVRFEQAAKLVRRYFSRARMSGTPIRFSRTPLREQPRRFRTPVLEFGQGLTVRVGRSRDRSSVRLADFGRARMSAILDPKGGLAVTSPLGPQYLIIPDSLPREIAEDFQRRLTKTVGEFRHDGYQVELVLYDDRGARSLKAQVDAIVRALDAAHVDGARALLVLPEHAKPDLHNFLKRTLKDRVPFQCVTSRKLRSHYVAQLSDGNRSASWRVRRERERNYVSYLRYTALGLLLVNRQWPFVLRDGPHYEAYIGLDVLKNTAAFSFFYKGGRICHVQACSSQRKEKLSRKQVHHMVYQHLKEDLRTLDSPPGSIVLRRDGRSFASEWAGFKEAVEQLKREGKLPSRVVYGMVEVPKSSASAVRIAEESNNHGVRNPRVGSWRVLEEASGVVCTTGWPFRLRGTANPLQVRVAEGQLDIEKVLEDTFAMAQLCWAAPDRCMRLPIDLKLCDEYLRAIASEADEDEAVFGEVPAEPSRVAVTAS